MKFKYSHVSCNIKNSNFENKLIERLLFL